MKYTQVYKIEEYNGTTFIGEDPLQVFSDHIKWVEEKKRDIIKDLHAGHGELINWEYNIIHETDPIGYNHIFYFRPLSIYGAAILRTLLYELIPGLSIRNSISTFKIDYWYKIEPHYTCFETFTSDYAMIYEYPRGTKEYKMIDESDAHILKNVVEMNNKVVKSS